MDIFLHTTRPDSSLFYQRNDENDVRLGETVLQNSDDYLLSDVVILGLPQDEGVRRNKGRVGSKDAPDAIRQSLYKYVTFQHLKIFDLGNTKIIGTLEEIHQIHQEIVRQVLQDGKTVIVLGGGNDTSYPDCSALSLETKGNLLAFNIDAHFDVRADNIRNSGTPYRQLLEEKLISPNQFYEIAYQPFANSATYLDYLTKKGVTTYSLGDVKQMGIAEILQQILEQHSIDAIFWGLDMDVVRGADAPGVSALNPTGLSGEEFCQVARIAGNDSRSRIFEITEVNPIYDIDGRTCRLAAAAIWYFLSAIENRITQKE